MQYSKMCMIEADGNPAAVTNKVVQQISKCRGSESASRPEGVGTDAEEKLRKYITSGRHKNTKQKQTIRSVILEEC